MPGGVCAGIRPGVLTWLSGSIRVSNRHSRNRSYGETGGENEQLRVRKRLFRQSLPLSLMIRKLVGCGTGAAPWLTAMDLPAIVSVAERAPPAFAEIVKLKVPEPLRVVVAMEIHVGTADASQVQPDAVAIEKLLVVPVADAETLAGVTVNVQVPRCVAVNVRPAIETVLVRWFAEVLTVNWMVTVPFPAPLAPAVRAIHEADFVAVQLQPAGAVTATVIVSPAASIVRLVGLMAYVHAGAAAACVIVTGCPAIVSVPLRPEVAVLAVAAKETVLVPVAGVADVIVIHEAELVAVHSHVIPAVTVIEPVDAPARSDAAELDSTGAQGAELAKAFDNALAEDPPGPTARTLA
jgi:hypothetical protein